MTLSRLLLAAAFAASLISPALAAPKKKKPAKKKPAAESKYKSTELSEASASVYRFNSKGEPIVPTAKKAKAKKKRSEPPEESASSDSSCGEDSACPAKGSEADAL